MALEIGEIADRVHDVIQRGENDLRIEQAVYGLDSMAELALHKLLADGLGAWFEVAREVHYPSSAGHKQTHRPRCDLVLTPKGRPLRRDIEAPTLFDPPEMIPPESAFWLEVKSASQYRAPGVRDSSYGDSWRTGVVNDLRKMEEDIRIRMAGLLLIVFVESQDVLDKDLELLEMVLMQQEVLAGVRQVRMVPILDRMGNRLCAAALWPTVQR